MSKIAFMDIFMCLHVKGSQVCALLLVMYVYNICAHFRFPLCRLYAQKQECLL